MVVDPPRSEQVGDILDFVDDAVMTGDLSGSGNGNSAHGRLGALIDMIEAAGDLIDLAAQIRALQASLGCR